MNPKELTEKERELYLELIKAREENDDLRDEIKRLKLILDTFGVGAEE